MEREGLPAQDFIRWSILSVTTLSAFMSAIDSNVVIVALPTIGSDLASGVSLLGWVVTGYVLTTAALLLQSGKIGDSFGRKRIFLLGFALFGISSALCGISQSIYELIAFRLVQGGAASMLTATGIPLVFEAFPPRERGFAIGVNSTAWAVGAVAGPVLGGVLVSIDWRLIFYINVPIAAAAVLIGKRKIPSARRPNQSETKPVLGGISILSSIMLAVSVAGLVLWLTFFNADFAALGLVALAGLVLLERRSASPLLDAEFRRNRRFAYALIALAVLQLASDSIPFAMSFYFQMVTDVSPMMTGFFLAPLTLTLVLSTPAAGRLYDRMRNGNLLTIVGALVTGVATAILGLAMDSRQSALYIDVLLGIIGIGSGFVWPPLINSIHRSASTHLRGAANGMAFTVVNIAFAAGIAITVAASASSLPSSVVSQIYLGSLGSLTAADVGLVSNGMARTMFALSLFDFVGIGVAYLLYSFERGLPAGTDADSLKREDGTAGIQPADRS